ncbi:dimethyladenosine transferase, putative [Theileria equi strain WA]|uniref:rRNA adenine N(6)-methyltransferase n=1 Tax=Theileria equi strain WA TaxID=1537102 RepID=L0B043_THEEQ|nr:dimethyladenosine transferase, putative [Theileria equi strain WA]AFZ80868.1 dimethyladenosine transferase, putative [Theileria equi strain WA]|eukprot:XP_004830534.1 dimethyladenosine transferase, putative [Theileria equi strain WA]
MDFPLKPHTLSTLSPTLIHNNTNIQVDYESMSKVKGEKLWIIGNLPFYITSQILFCLVDYKSSIDRAVVTAQLEVAKRIVANPGDTDYSILSVVLQLYATPKLLFTIPNYAFYPKPKVHSGVISLAFDPEKQPKCAPLILKRILKDSFGQRRKKLKTSLSQFLEQQEIESLPHPLPDMRPQQLSPNEFESLALWIEKNGNFTATPKSYKLSDNRRLRTRMGPEALEISPRIWRQEKHGE